MKRWQMTAGLTGLALGAVWLAPRLFAHIAAPVPVAHPPLVEPPPPVPSGYDGHLSVVARIDQSSILDGDRSDRFVTVEITAEDVPSDVVRRPVDVAVVLDASGSMKEGRLEEAIHATVRLAGSLTPADTLSVVAFSGQARVLLGAESMRSPEMVAATLADLHAHGGTNLYAGLEVGARSLARRPGATQHLVVLSDGNATEGELRPERFADLASQLASERVSLSTVGLGATYNEDLLASLADLGGGRYDDVALASQIQAVFDETFARSTTVVAQGTRVDLVLPAGLEPVDLLGWAGQRIDGGWTVSLGDMSSGERRKVVARVRPTGNLHGEQSIHARLTYHDVTDRRGADESSRATVAATSDAEVARRSLDPSVAALARRTYGNWYLEMATRTYAEGDRAKSLDLIERGRRVLQEAADEVPMPDLDRDLLRFDTSRDLYERQAPSAPAAQRHIKQSKDRFRTIAR
jgi:Ca-activated chloride channel family protein